MIYYFHGFASSAKSWKICHLQECLGEGRVYAPDLPVDPALVISSFEEFVAQTGMPELLIGSSLGGFYALYMNARFGLPGVLLNPSLTPWETLAPCVGVNKRYYTAETFQWEAAYLDRLRDMGASMETLGCKQERLYFYLALDDDVLDHGPVPALFPRSRVRFFDNCGHTFSRFEEIVPEIEALLK